MVCETVRLPGGGAALVCGPRRRRPRCAAPGCAAPSEFQCDAPVGRRTCDRHLCRRHRTPGGVGVDFCPEHADHVRQPALL